MKTSDFVTLSGINDFFHIKGRYIVKASLITFEIIAKNATRFGIENCSFTVQTSLNLETISNRKFQYAFTATSETQRFLFRCKLKSMNEPPFVIIAVRVPPTLSCPPEVKKDYLIKSSRMQVSPIHLLVREPNFCLAE